MRLSSRLFLLFLLSGITPMLVLLGVGWIQFRQQFRLWTVPSFEQALDASLQTNRRSMDRVHAQLEAVGQDALSSPDLRESTFDSPDRLGPVLARIREVPGVDFVQYYERRQDRWGLVASSGSDSAAVAAAIEGIPVPEASDLGPQRARPLRLAGPDGDLFAVPVYRWRSGAASGDAPAEPVGCLLLGTVLGPEFFGQLETASTGLGFYRRFLEVGRVLRNAYLGILVIALLASLSFSLWLARRVARGVSRPVENLVGAMGAVGSGVEPEAPVRSRIPEMETLARAFERMRRTLKQYEEQLRGVEQVRGAQETARFVAHEIRNTLTPVQAGLAVLEKRVLALPEESREPGRRALEAIRREADRMASLATSFSEYAHLPDPEVEPLEVAPLLRHLGTTDVPEAIRVELALPERLPRVRADRDDVERLFRNLIKNAVEAMEGSGTLRIAAGYDAGAERLWVDVEDTGGGMDPKTLEKAMQPGFTTKQAGSGLGLALVRRSVIRYGGTFQIESEPGRGTHCRVSLPVIPAEDETR
jgi:nitrogen fixation/metabolism regulation signal transduction histidine kinase